ncbi:hypothetical protein Tco_1325846 [Tanacetum coccineum]
MTTLAEHMIVSGADNRPPMLKKSMYDSWQSLDGVTKPKSYEELSEKEKLQADCDLKATKIVLQGLPPDVYSLINHHEVAKEIWDRVRLLMKGTELSQQEQHLPIQETKLPFKMAGLLFNKFKGDRVRVLLCTQPKRPRNSTWFKEKMLLVQAEESSQTDDLDAYDLNCDDISLAKAVLMANLSSYDSGYFEQSPIDNYLDTEITSDSNIISYEQYLQETQNAVVQDTNSSAEQDVLIMSVFEQMCNQERVKLLEERQNVDLNSREKYIDSQMNDMILHKNSKFASFEDQFDTLKQNISKFAKENECLMTSIQVSEKQTQEKEDKYIEKEIDLEKEKKELENIMFKVGQSAQMMHMLTKP